MLGFWGSEVGGGMGWDGAGGWMDGWMEVCCSSGLGRVLYGRMLIADSQGLKKN